MTTNDARPRGMDPDLATAEAGISAEEQAKELIAHGLLQAHYRESDADTERRVSRLLSAIDAEDRARRAAHEPARGLSFTTRAARTSRWRSLRFATGLAAAMTLIAVMAIEFTPTNSALAAVQASVEASKSAGDRRYGVKVQPQKDKGDEFIAIATLDVRDPEHVVIKAKTPQGHRVTVGRSPEGVWAIRPDGTVDRYAPKSAMPRWVNFGSNTIVLESVDDLMNQLARDYTLTRGEAAALPGASGVAMNRITARIKGGHMGPEPERVEIWLDSGSRVVKRLELHWPEFAPRGGDGLGEGDRNELPEGAGGPPGRRRGPGGPRERDGRPPMDGPRPGGAGPHEGEMVEHPSPERRDEMDPDRRPPREGEMRGPHGPMVAGGPIDGLRGPMGGPREPGRERGRGPMGGSMGGPPQFLGERPDFRRGGPGGPPPPPRVMVFELEEGATFAEGWFEPDAHALK